MIRTLANKVHTASAKQHRFHLLDAIRGMAALLVVAYHAPPDFGRLVPFRSGFLAVDLFFALSGFVIAFSYERRLREGLSYLNFVVARLIRLYPVYLLGLVFAVCTGIVTTHTLSPHVLPQMMIGLLMLPDVFHGSSAAVYPLDFPAWSLLCELLSNLGYAALVFWNLAGHWLLYLIIAGSAAYMVMWTRSSGTMDSGSVVRTLPMGLARVGYSFGAGVLVFRYGQAKQRKRLSGLASALLAAGVCVVVFAVLATRMTHAPASQLVTAIVVFPILIYLGALTSITGRLAAVAAFLGDTSYPIYLLHIPFFTFFRGRSMHQLVARHAYTGPLIALLSFAMLLTLSWVAAKWFDLPVRRALTTTYNRRIRDAALSRIQAAP